jgi:hypothetical protein
MENNKTMTRKEEILATDLNELSECLERLENYKPKMYKALRSTHISRTMELEELWLNDFSLDYLLGVNWGLKPNTEEGFMTVTREEVDQIAENLARYEVYLDAYYDDAMDTVEMLGRGEAKVDGELTLHRYVYCQEMICWCYWRLIKWVETIH